MNLHFPLLISFFLVFQKSYAFNITKVLSDNPTFSKFNDYLTQTNLATQINSRETITVLAVANRNLSPLSGKSQDVQKNILSVHIILDYFDVPKIQQLNDGATTLTTLFQTTGLAQGQQGFLNVTHLSNNRVAFGSAMQGAGPGSVLVESVASEPYNLSVLHVSTAIIPPGLDGTANSTSNNSTSPSPSTSPPGSPRVSPTPSMSPKRPPSVSPQASPPQRHAPSDAPSNAQPPAGTLGPATGAPSNAQPPAGALGPATDAPSNAQSPAGALGPTADAPSNAQSPAGALGPAADAPPNAQPPAGALGPAAAPGGAGPIADAPVADAPAPNAPADGGSNKGTDLQVGFCVVFTMVISSIFLAQWN